MFSTVHADVYDALYEHRSKDPAGEAAMIVERIREHRPDARAVLDVGCGTGAHLGVLDTSFDHVEGVDLAEPMLAIARRRHPSIPLHHGDMCDVSLPRTFDAIVCLFCVIAYAGDLGRIRAAVANMAAHLAPGGVLVVEPFWFTERFLDGYVNGDVFRDDRGRVISRVSHSVRVGDHIEMDVRFVIADPAGGIEHHYEPERLSLCTEQEYRSAFTDAGLAVTYHDGTLGGRGMFVAVKE